LSTDGQARIGLILRAATESDSDRLLGWRNDPDAITFSISRRPVGRTEHQRWLAWRLAEPAARLWIAEQAGHPVGQVRVDVEDGVGTVSIAVAPEHRGRGLGTAILEALNAEAGRDGAIRRLRALVHPENPASLRAFTRAGYQARQNPEHGFLVLERGIGAHE